MTIEPDVRGIAKDFGIDAQLLQAVVRAEGGGTAIIRAIQCSFPAVTTREAALRITARSCVHAMCDWIRNGGDTRRDSFVEFWASRWAPIGAKNDPAALNANWASNVERLWRSPLENRT
jgi:hypothetical protein